MAVLGLIRLMGINWQAKFGWVHFLYVQVCQSGALHWLALKEEANGHWRRGERLCKAPVEDPKITQRKKTQI